MELRSDNLKNMSTGEIIKKLLPTFMGIYTSFRYLELSKEDFFEIVYTEIKKTKDNYNNKKPYSEFIKNRVRFLIVETERKKVVDSNEAYRILNNYVNYYFKDLSLNNNSVALFKKIDRVISLYEIELNPALIIELLKNSLFNNLIKNIVSNLLPDLSHKKIENVYNNNSFISVVEVYAMINNIEINETVDEFLEDDYLGDDIEIYLKDISSKKVLTSQEEKELFKRYQNGDMDAKRELIECNLKLAYAFAKRQYCMRQGKGLSLQDLIQEANLGILRALEKFDPEMGCKFSTYAVNWIRQKMIRARMDKERIVRIPVYLHNGLATYLEKVNQLEKELEKEPTTDEIAEKLNIPLKKVMHYHELMLDNLSLNSYVDDENDKEIEEFLVHSDNEVEDCIFDLQLKEDIQTAFEIANLNPRERLVLELRFGLNNNKILTLQAIADKCGITRERIRQIEARALNKIRASKAAIILAEYTDNPDKNKRIRSKVYGYCNYIK